MKVRALDLCRGVAESQKKNLLREYLQAHILYSIQVAGGFQHLVFQGGTALRFLYQLRRFSEDLDFAIESTTSVRLEVLRDQIVADLKDSGFEVNVYEKGKGAVRSFSFRIPGLLLEAGLSRREAENLSVHVEVDTVPPSGANSMTSLINRFFFLSLRHHDLSSSLSGKIHALFTRRYTKGRDLYDLLWYLTRPEKIEPNFEFLSNALKQTGWEGKVPGVGNWKQELLRKIEGLDWKAVRDDVAPFLEDGREAQLLSAETLEKLLWE